MTDLKHESYGLVSFSRRSGNPPLFGSHLPQSLTQNYVCLSVRQATLIRTDDGDHYHGSMRGDLIEVNLSESQFASLLTTMNVGMGVPCTVAYVCGKRMQDPPELATEAENIRESFKTTISKQSEELQKEVLPKIQEILEKKTLSKADREAILKAFNTVVRQNTDSIPFTLDLFQEATEKVVTAAKTDIDAFLTSAVTQAGLAALQSGSVQIQIPALPGKDKE